MHPTPGNPVLVQLQPQSLRQLLNDMADQLAYEIEERRLSKVGVLEFTTILGPEELRVPISVTSAMSCADQLEKRLMDLGTDKFKVVNRRVLQSALKDQNFQVQDLGSPKSLKGVSTRLGGLPVLVQGLVRSRHGREVTLQCKLIQTESDELAGSVGGKALLSESEMRHPPDSYEVTPADRMPEASRARASPLARSGDEQLFALTDGAARSHTPCRTPFPISRQDRDRRPGTHRASPRQRVAGSRQEGRSLPDHIENKTNVTTCMRLLVDGLNWLPEQGERPRTRVSRRLYGANMSVLTMPGTPF